MKTNIIKLHFDLKRIIKFIYVLSFFAVIILTGYFVNFIHTELWVKDMIKSGINYDDFREYSVSKNSLNHAKKKVNHLIKRHPDLAGKPYVDEIGYITFSMIARDYDLIKHKVTDEQTFTRGIGRLSQTKSFRELYGYNRAILSDLKYFPVPNMGTENAYVTYDDSWNGLRTYGGNRRHEGTDLMASNNIRGYFPVISVTDGIVENIGWLDKGGNRIGIRSQAGGYFYYAHLYSYAPGMKKGDKVIAGQLLGFMGDSGYGKEGTIGKFDVHLHFGIYVNSSFGEMSVDPYRILKFLEENKLSYEK